MQIDHVEIMVPDRDAARVWYSEWSGFKAMPEHADWVETGPILLTNDGGAKMLALFTGDSGASDRIVRGWCRVAFRVMGAELWDWSKRFRDSGQALEGPCDHDKAWSVYFSDPWGNALEVATDDDDEVREVAEETK